MILLKTFFRIKIGADFWIEMKKDKLKIDVKLVVFGYLITSRIPKYMEDIKRTIIQGRCNR